MASMPTSRANTKAGIARPVWAKQVSGIQWAPTATKPIIYSMAAKMTCEARTPVKPTKMDQPTIQIQVAVTTLQEASVSNRHNQSNPIIKTWCRILLLTSQTRHTLDYNYNSNSSLLIKLAWRRYQAFLVFITHFQMNRRHLLSSRRARAHLSTKAISNNSRRAGRLKSNLISSAAARSARCKIVCPMEAVICITSSLVQCLRALLTSPDQRILTPRRMKTGLNSISNQLYRARSSKT